MESKTETTRRGINDVPLEWNRITEAIIGAAMEVHSLLGPGLLERLYEQAMVYECSKRGLVVKRQVPINLQYKEIALGEQVLDLVIDELVVVEIKSVDRVHDVHTRQLVSYMKSARLPLGLLINFNVDLLRNGIYRRVLTRNTPVPSSFLVDQTHPE